MLSLAVDRAARDLAKTEKAAEDTLRAALGRAVGLPAVSLGHCYSNGAALTRRQRDSLRTSILEVSSRESGGVSAAELASVLMTFEGDERSVPTNQFTAQIAKSDAVNAVVEIAHDMRSPLTSILFLVETLRRGRSGPVTPVQERQLGLIYGAALGLNTLACDVIDAVRGGQRLFDGHAVPFSIAEVIIGVCDTVRPISEEKGIPISLELPKVDGRIGYPGALGRVLLNLMTNALKYTNEGSVAVGATEVTDTRLSFWVSDTGQGIPENVLGMLFDGFRPSASGLRFSNAGLGLAICRDFLESMGTSLEVQSEPGVGTRFSFEIELQRA